MIKSFRHKGLQRFYETGKVTGIQPHHARRLKLQLAALDTAQSIEDMDVPGFTSRFTGARKGALVDLGQRELAADFQVR